MISAVGEPNATLIAEITGSLKGYTLLFARSLGSQVIEETKYK